VATVPIVIESLGTQPVAHRRVELVERKGIGHPDTICDALVEAISIALNRMYLAELGAVPHYNIDKALLIAGQCAKGFGWGTLTQPMEFVIGDRATFAVDGHKLPVEETAREAVSSWLGEYLPRIQPAHDFVTRVALAPGSAELRSIFVQGPTTIAANDTSGASGYAPLTPTEEIVLAIEHFLNGRGFKRDFPDTGWDVKVFAVREDARLRITIAMPLMARLIPSEAAYFRRKDEILAALAEHFRDAALVVDWRLNNLDTPGHGSDGVYLTVTGTSAEDADSGQVGRGNRANGLIAFSRPTGGEAAAGKNPVAHTGKIYSVLSHRLAERIHVRLPELLEVHVHLVSRIGEPVDRPWTGVQVVLPKGGALADVEGPLRDVVQAEIERLPEFRRELIRGVHRVC
jgi:S-adenosylmethionine synthetase